VAGRYHTRVFVEWRRLHQVVTLLLPAPSELSAADDQSEYRRPRVIRLHSAAGQLPVPSSGHGASNGHEAVVVSVPADEAVPADALHGHRALYTRSQLDGRWTFGRLPATSVSDTAAAAATCQPLDV